MHLIRELVRQNYTITAFVRPTSNLHDLITLPITITYGDLLKKDDLTHALKNHDIVIHTAALLKNATYPEYYDAHVETARNLISTCREKNIRRVIVISTTSTLAQKRTPYGATKHMADLLFTSSGLDITTIKPDFIYGTGGRGFTTITNLVKNLPIIPVFGDGKYTKQPIHVTDVVRAITTCIEDASTIGKTYVAAGTKQVTFNEIIATLQTELNMKKRIIHVPKILCYSIARILRNKKNAPLTKDSLDGLFQNSDFDTTALQEQLRVTPLDFERGVKMSLL